MRKIYSILSAVLLLFTMSAHAQTDGYNRLVNVESEGVANLASSWHFAPDVDPTQALSIPGTVAYMKFGEADGAKVVTDLRVQGIDVVKEVIPTMKSLLPTLLDEDSYLALRDSAENMVLSMQAGAIGTLFVSYLKQFSYQDFLAWVDEIDTNLYYEVDEESVAPGYNLYFKSPKFPLDAGDLNSYFVSKMNSYFALYRGRFQDMADQYFVGREDLLPMVYSLISHMRFEDRLYLIVQEGEYDFNFGFANQSDIFGTQHLWRFIPVDADNPLGLNGEFEGANGKWYTSFAAGFPVYLGEGMTAYGVTEDINMVDSKIGWKKLDTDFIPAFTPVIMELSSRHYNKNILTLTESSAVMDEPSGLILATDDLGLLLGRMLDEPDPHYYKLGVKDGNVCLVSTEEQKLYPNQAYYYLSDNMKQRDTTGYLLLVDDPDGISEVNVERAGENIYYDLQGRRVNNPVRGIYVKNGKKVMVR